MLFSNSTAVMVINDTKENDKHLTSSGSYLTNNCKAYLMWKKWGSWKGGKKWLESKLELWSGAWPFISCFVSF